MSTKQTYIIYWDFGNVPGEPTEDDGPLYSMQISARVEATDPERAWTIAEPFVKSTLQPEFAKNLKISHFVVEA